MQAQHDPTAEIRTGSMRARVSSPQVRLFPFFKPLRGQKSRELHRTPWLNISLESTGETVQRISEAKTAVLEFKGF